MSVVKCHLLIVSCQLSTFNCLLIFLQLPTSIINCQYLLLIISCQMSTFNCHQSTVHFQFSRDICQLWTFKSHLSTFNSQLYIVKCQLSTFICPLWTLNSQLSTVNCQPLNPQFSTVNRKLTIVNNSDLPIVNSW